MKIIPLLLLCPITFLFYECKKSHSSDTVTFDEKVALLKGYWIEDSLVNTSSSITVSAIQPSYLHIDTALNFALLTHLTDGESYYDTGHVTFGGSTAQFNSINGTRYFSSFGSIGFVVTQKKLVLNTSDIAVNNDDNWYFHR